MNHIARQTVLGGKLAHLHPGEMDVYRGVHTGSSDATKSGASWSKSKEEASKFSRGKKVLTKHITKDTPAVDVNKAIGREPKEYEQEVYVPNNSDE